MEKVEMIGDNETEINDLIIRGWGHTSHYMDLKQITELLQGKLIAINDGEYTHTIKLKL